MTHDTSCRAIEFGTDGIRGKADQFPFTSDALYALGKAIAGWAVQKYGKQNPKILLGADTRASGDRVKRDLCVGLMVGGVVVFDGGVLPTPAVYQLVMSDASFDAGIVISASHNPYEDNGIKIFDRLKCKINVEDEDFIKRHVQHFFTTTAQFGSVSVPELLGNAVDLYQEKIRSLFTQHFLHNVKVVLDCAHGATSWVAPALFKSLGADVHVIAAQPNGTNINDGCGALHPHVLARVVREQGALCGFAFDGDGDRVVAVNRHGEVRDGDDLIALLLQLPAYHNIKQVVGTVMTNKGLEAFLATMSKSLTRTRVGDKYIAMQLEKDGVPLGGEPSGHIILRDYLATGDGIFVALKIMESIMTKQNWDMTTFVKYPQVLINVPVKNKRDLNLPPYARILLDYEKKLGLGRLVVRYSGTEHLLRVMTEAESVDTARLVACELAQELQKALQD